MVLAQGHNVVGEDHGQRRGRLKPQREFGSFAIAKNQLPFSSEVSNGRCRRHPLVEPLSICLSGYPKNHDFAVSCRFRLGCHRMEELVLTATYRFHAFQQNKHPHATANHETRSLVHSGHSVSLGHQPQRWSDRARDPSLFWLGVRFAAPQYSVSGTTGADAQ